MNLMKKTGFFTGLFPKELLDGKAIADKNDKLKFLQLVIDCISIVSGKDVDVKAAKIVAGHEAEQTNKMLQEIAMAILTKKSSDEAVAQIKSGEKPKEKSSKSSKEKTEKREPRDESKQREKKSEKRSESKPREDKKESKERRDKSERRDRDKSKKRETSEERRVRKGFYYSADNDIQN